MALENFNIDRFNKEKKADVYSFKLDNGEDVQESSDTRIFVERIEEKSSPFGIYKEFYDSGKLKTKSRTFYGFMIGIQYEYDKSANIIDSISYDAPFQFTINDMVVKIKKTYNVDLLDKSLRATVSRNALPRPLYGIAIPIVPGVSESGRKVLTVDGTTGALVSESIKAYMK